jgi:shikimate dehydrogenase
MTDQYAVFGNPISHSLSPVIHQQFALETHQDLSYHKVEVPTDQLKEYIRDFQDRGGKGLNITLPFKREAYSLTTVNSTEATIAQATNTLSFQKDGTILGHNTDGIGLIRDLMHNLDCSIVDKRILILGAGGAVRGIVFPLLNQVPKQIVIANRTLESAQELEENMDIYGNIIAVPLDKITGEFDIVINGTSLGVSTNQISFDPKIITKETFCYDLIYGQELTPFLKWAVAQGAKRVADGMGMLVEQAAESFYIWRGQRPNTSKVLKLLKTIKSRNDVM